MDRLLLRRKQGWLLRSQSIGHNLGMGAECKLQHPAHNSSHFKVKGEGIAWVQKDKEVKGSLLGEDKCPVSDVITFGHTVSCAFTCCGNKFKSTS